MDPAVTELSAHTGKAPPLDFELPAELEASEPAEERGLRRDDVRLLVSYRGRGQIVHTRFRDLPRLLESGDVVVINTSGTRPAAVPAHGSEGAALWLHVSTKMPENRWLVELRRPKATGTAPYKKGCAGDVVHLPGGGRATLIARHGGRSRLWIASLDLGGPIDSYLDTHGAPIRYRYVCRDFPLSFYQNVYATERGSAEMASAGRPFTEDLITRLVARGILVAPLLLHTGVSSLEADEPPYEEYYRVPPATAQVVNGARADGRRVIAVGTTTVRALESASARDGQVHPGDGWTDLVINSDRGLHTVDGLITGFHEPKATHLAILKALIGSNLLRQVYGEALRRQYLWHEFGDSHLILP